MDNYFTSGPLVEELAQDKIYVAGTIKQRAVGFPEGLKSVKLSKGNYACERVGSDLKFSLIGMEAIRDQLEGDRYNLENQLGKNDQEYCQVGIIAITLLIPLLFGWPQVFKDLKTMEKNEEHLGDELSMMKVSADHKDQVISDENREIENYESVCWSLPKRK